MRVVKISIVLLMAFGSLASCYRDKAELLYPTGVCETTDVRYSQDIRPIMERSCAYAGCHAGATPADGLDLSTYDQTAGAGMDGSLLGSVRHDPGYHPMPQNGVRLPDCDIAHIAAWVSAGAPNN